MSKKEVLNIVGKSYQLLSAEKTAEGTSESILLKDERSSNFVLTFLGNELIGIKRDRFGNGGSESVRPAEKK